MAEIKEVDFKKLEAGAVRERLKRAIDFAIDSHGDDLAGYAIVTWDKIGQPVTSINAEIGPLGPGMVPMFAHDALNRHVAVNLAQRDISADFPA